MEVVKATSGTTQGVMMLGTGPIGGSNGVVKSYHREQCAALGDEAWVRCRSTRPTTRSFFSVLLLNPSLDSFKGCNIALP